MDGWIKNMYHLILIEKTYNIKNHINTKLLNMKNDCVDEDKGHK